MNWLQVAELCVKYKNQGVCGMGIYGDQDLPAGAYQHYVEIFDFLHQNNIKLAVFAGKEEYFPTFSSIFNKQSQIFLFFLSGETISNALHIAGASRLSGAFAVHHKPRLMDHIATNSIPIETSLTSMFEEQTRSIKKFYVSPIRLLYDAGLHITPCSFR